MNSGYFTVDQTLGSQYTTEGRIFTLRKVVIRVDSLVANTVMEQTAQLGALLVSLFLFQELKCLRSYNLCLP